MKITEFIKNHKIAIIFLIAFILIAAAITVVVAQYLATSNEVTGTVQPTPTPTPTPPPQATLSLTINGGADATITVGEDFTLTATLSDSLDGVTVTFYQGTIGSGTSIGQSTTTGGGVATYTFTPAVGSYTYYAVADHP